MSKKRKCWRCRLTPPNRPNGEPEAYERGDGRWLCGPCLVLLMYDAHTQEQNKVSDAAMEHHLNHAGFPVLNPVLPLLHGQAPMRLALRPVSLAEARAFVVQHHRHSEPPVGHKVSVGVEDETGVLHGVGILGRPVARGSDNGRTAEVLRIATDGTPNACSMLYGALVRAAFALGYQKVITYTLESESGASLRASGWQRETLTDGGEWKHTAGARSADKPTLFFEAKMPTERKVRWVRAR